MSVPLCRIEHALKGKMDFVIATNPFGSKGEKAEEPELLDSPMDDARRQKVAADIAAGFDRLAG